MRFDHAVIAVHDLDAAMQDYRDLGFTVLRGGVHANRATHNALVVFTDGTYLELLARTGETPVPAAIDFSRLLDRGEGLVGFALRTEDIEAESARVTANGFKVGDVIPMARRREDGRVVQGKLALIDDGFAPFLFQDVTPRDWRIPNDAAVTTHDNRAVGLRGVEIAVLSLADARERYGRLFGVSPAPDQQVIECVILSEANAGQVEGLVALHLERGDDGEEGGFPVGRTHGVRFGWVAGMR